MSKPYAESAAVRRHRRLLHGSVALGALLLCACSATAPKPVPAATAPVAAPAPPPVPDAVLAAWAQALGAMKRQDWSAAETALQALNNGNPDLPGPAVNLGIVYVHLNRTADARRMFESAVARWPGFAPAQHQLGLLLRAQGEFEAADAAFAKALAADPGYALACYDRAVLNELYLQRPQVALEHYERFQRLQPIADAQVARWIEDLRRRTGNGQPAAKPASTEGARS